MNSVLISTSPLVKTYTLNEFWELPEPEDHSRRELIAGVLYMARPPNYSHDSITSRLIDALVAHRFSIADKGKLYTPRAAIWTSDKTYLEPDLFYLSAELEATLDKAFRSTADLVIEILSPASEQYDRTTKADTYGVLGVRELWLVDPTNCTIEVRTQTGNGFDKGTVFSQGEVIKSQIFPQLDLPVTLIFADLG